MYDILVNIKFFRCTIDRSERRLYTHFASKFFDEGGGAVEELTVLPLTVQSNAFRPYVLQFKALADEKRLQILYELCQRGKTCVCDLTELLNTPQSSLSYHLKMLVDAGLIRRETQGTWSYYDVDPDGVNSLLSEELCCIFRPAPSRC